MQWLMQKRIFNLNCCRSLQGQITSVRKSLTCVSKQKQWFYAYEMRTKNRWCSWRSARQDKKNLPVYGYLYFVTQTYSKNIDINHSETNSTLTLWAQGFDGLSGLHGSGVVEVGLCAGDAVLDKPPSLAVALHLVFTHTGSSTQRRHFIQCAVIWSLAKQGH